MKKVIVRDNVKEETAQQNIECIQNQNGASLLLSVESHNTCGVIPKGSLWVWRGWDVNSSAMHVAFVGQATLFTVAGSLK